MALILGIDAAWTKAGSTGIALLETRNGRRTVLTANSSYADFLQDDAGDPQLAGMPPDAALLLRKAENIAGATVDLVAIDMPMARTRITGRRVADNAISAAFSAQWASTHSPNEMRPGSFGERVANSFAKAGYRLATDSLQLTAGRALVEVYPLVALVRLLNATVRPAYKMAKIAKYYRNIVPPLSKELRIERLLETWAEILTALGREISDFHFELPQRPLKSATELKPYEDKLDAIICAWVGACVIEKRAQPYGNHDSAIWAPICIV
jgi:predicted RNase H-like nuclease